MLALHVNSRLGYSTCFESKPRAVDKITGTHQTTEAPPKHLSLAYSSHFNSLTHAILSFFPYLPRIYANLFLPLSLAAGTREMRGENGPGRKKKTAAAAPKKASATTKSGATAKKRGRKPKTEVDVKVKA